MDPSGETLQLIPAALAAASGSGAGLDPDYPRFHLAPPVGRLNDPNGLIVRDGVYHAFFQFGPFFPHRKEIFWGHATSTDLVTWQQLPPAIAPLDWYDRSGVYSGGAAVRAGQVWLFYTGNVKDAEDRRESYQCAVVTDDLETFAKHPANPLIPAPPPGYTMHVRDPQVLAGPDGWRMLLGAQRADNTGCILLFSSRDLAGWSFDGELGFPGTGGRFDDFGFMWECPNLLRVPDVATGELRDVLIFCPQGVGPEGEYFRNIYPCGYLVGELDGTDFRPSGEFTELDRGFEFYAPQAFVGSAGGQAGGPILVGWVGNPSEDAQPSLTEHGWVHLLSLPRELTLRDGVLHQRPVVDLAEAPRRSLALQGEELLATAAVLSELDGVRSFALHLEVDQSAAGEWALELGTAPGSRVVLSFRRGSLTVDRTATRYPHGGTRTVSIPPSDRLTVEVVHDRSVTEVFVADGHTAFTMRSYLDPGTTAVRLAASGRLRVEAAGAVIFD